MNLDTTREFTLMLRYVAPFALILVVANFNLAAALDDKDLKRIESLTSFEKKSVDVRPCERKDPPEWCKDNKDKEREELNGLKNRWR